VEDLSAHELEAAGDNSADTDDQSKDHDLAGATVGEGLEVGLCQDENSRGHSGIVGFEF
jgi:hypothetical protein